MNNKSLTIVSPGSQTRNFTHVSDTVLACYHAWKKNKNMHYSISSNKSYSIRQIANFFSNKIKYLPERSGERFLSALTLKNLNNKIIRLSAKIKLKDYFAGLETKLDLQKENTKKVVSAK